MEPKDVLNRYASEGGEHGLLRAVADVYQGRITSNRERLRGMNIVTVIATGLVMLGVVYGAMMVFQNRYETLPPPRGTQGSMQPPAQEP